MRKMILLKIVLPASVLCFGAASLPAQVAGPSASEKAEKKNALIKKHRFGQAIQEGAAPAPVPPAAAGETEADEKAKRREELLKKHGFGQAVRKDSGAVSKRSVAPSPSTIKYLQRKAAQ